MKKSFKINSLIIVVSCIQLMACGNSNKQLGATKTTGGVSSVEALSKKSKIGTVNCDGEGTEFSGKYSLKLINKVYRCGSEKDKPIGTISTDYTCVQKDKNFSCGGDLVKLPYVGCIGKDGRFNLSRSFTPQDPKYKEEQEFLVGTLNKDDGTYQAVIVPANVQNTNSCIVDAGLELQLVSH